MYVIYSIYGSVLCLSQKYLAVQSAGKYAYAAWVARLGYAHLSNLRDRNDKHRCPRCDKSGTKGGQGSREGRREGGGRSRSRSGMRGKPCQRVRLISVQLVAHFRLETIKQYAQQRRLRRGRWWSRWGGGVGRGNQLT